MNPGFQPGGVITANVALPLPQYKDPDKQVAFFRAVLERLSNMPGASKVAAAERTLPGTSPPRVSMAQRTITAAMGTRAGGTRAGSNCE